MFRPDLIGAVALQTRTQDVTCPELPDEWFAGGEKIITVRQLTGNELAMVQGAEQSRDLRAALAKAIETGSLADVTQSAKEATGQAEVITPVYARKLEAVKFGIVSDPPMDDAQVVELGERFAVTFDRLYLTIQALTGKGAEAEKKPNASTRTKASKQA